MSLYAQDSLYSHRIGVNWQNDLFLKLDRDFTNGVDISYMRSLRNGFKIPVVKKKGVKLALPYGYQEFSLVQHIFTPENLGTDEIIYEDRPYAGYLLLRVKDLGYSKSNEYVITSSWDIGVLGPAAYGGNVQDFIHDNTPSPAPEGWDNQIQNDLVLNYNFGFEKALSNQKSILITVPSLMRLGTLYTDLTTGVKVRCGKFQNYFESPNNFSKRDKVQVYMEVQASAQLVAYNATLQGGVFSKENEHVIDSNDLERLRLSGMVSLSASFKKMMMSIGTHFNTKSYSFGEGHRYGFIVLSYSF